MRGYDPRVNARMEINSQVNAPVGLAEAQTEPCPHCGARKRRRCTYAPHDDGGLQMRGRVHYERKQVIKARRKAELRALAAWFREHGHIFEDASRA